MRDVLKNEMNYIKIEDFIDYGFCEEEQGNDLACFPAFIR